MHTSSVSSVDEALGRLRWITTRLRMNGQFVVLGLLAQAAFAIWTIVGPSFRFGLPEIPLLMAIVTCVCVVFLVVMNESLRSRGDVLFEELSDELEWHMRSAEKSAGARQTPPMDTRLVLREFVHAGYPLLRGKSAGALCAALSFALMFVTAIYFRSYNY